MPSKQRADDLETQPTAADTAAEETTAAAWQALSAGEVDDLINAGVTISPFTGRRLNALALGIEPGNPEAYLTAEADLAARGE